MFLGLPDPDLLVRDTDPHPENPHVLGLPDPDPLVRSFYNQAKIVRKTLIPTVL